MMAFAEFERDLIIQRIREGKEIARMKEGFHEGRPKKYSDEELSAAVDLLEAGSTYAEVTSSTGISASTLVRAKRRRNALNST